MSEDLAILDATAQAALVRGGDVSPLELVDAAIERVEKLDPELNAVIHPLFDKARNAARSPDLPDGPFRGVPMVFKDLMCAVAGDPHHQGTRVLRDAAFRAPTTYHVAERFLASGFVCVGRTNTPELGLLPTTEPEAYGPTRNPWCTDRTTGGSSGGSAAAVASGMVPVAHANDGGGSIRIPASCCGLVGLKPSRGRVSLGPEAGELASFLDVEGVVSRSVRDTAAVLDAVAAPFPGDPVVAPAPARPFAHEIGAEPGSLRIGLLTTAPAGAGAVHADCVAAAEAAACLLETLGHRVEVSYPAALDDQALFEVFLVMWPSNTAHALARVGRAVGRELTADDVEAPTWALADSARAIDALELLDAVHKAQAFSRRVARWWHDDGFDLLLTPTLGEPPLPLGAMGPTPERPLAGLEAATTFVPFTPPFNVTGQPAISLPLHRNDAGLPVGVQLVAAYSREDVLLRVASQLEQAAPWADRRPPVHA